MGQNLSGLLACCEGEILSGAAEKSVSGICYNSRQAGQDFIFIAFKGLHTDGHNYIPDAVARGAAVVIFDQAVPAFLPGVTYIKVNDSRKAMSRLCAAFYDFPANKLKLVGVTGTDGKSSTVWFIYQLLAGSSVPAGFLSTVHYMAGDTVKPNPYRQSTPEAWEINTILDTMVKNNLGTAILETTSHGLASETGRLADISFTAAVLTNITHEHLEFHGTFAHYRHAKANLFRQLRKDPSSFGVVNLNDPEYGYFAEAAAGAPVYLYALDNQQAHMYAVITDRDITGTAFRLFYEGTEYAARLNIPGDFNIENLLAALLTVQKLMQIDMKALLSLVPGLTAPPGRLCSLSLGQPFSVIVDYAHTPNAFERIFRLFRPLTPNKLITVFGSAGERDIIKRALQGETAARFADIVVLTDEDPRGEDPLKILEEISTGCPHLTRGKNLFLIPDRKSAIRHALSLAGKGDTVLLLGKGHEVSIIYADGPKAWNEIEAARALLGELV